MMKRFKIIGYTLLLGALVVGTYFLITSREGSVNGASFLKELSFKETGIRFIPKGWQEYKSELHGFSLLYKDDLVVKTFDEGGGASTITFENASSSVGFQIFVVPYGETQISQERFLKDSPLGVRENLKDLNLDSVVAQSFYSKSMKLGDTWEVWFIRNGLLYEISTLKPLENWLADIIKTWLFL